MPSGNHFLAHRRNKHRKYPWGNPNGGNFLTHPDRLVRLNTGTVPGILWPPSENSHETVQSVDNVFPPEETQNHNCACQFKSWSPRDGYAGKFDSIQWHDSDR
ncbi:hypothetical protein BaRGS_00012344 [Batillaria attramentaria]|uniref:Uncharacterized protein n=1 Tax=Batillaria attramentaria TaxID=370345 RepID=A0ABD0LBU3_9CAEN